MKIKCPLCDFENEEGARFCSNCNEPFPNAVKNPYAEKAKYYGKNEKQDSKSSAVMGFLFLIVLVVAVALFISNLFDSEEIQPERLSGMAMKEQQIKKEIDQQSGEYSIGYKLCVIDGDYEKEDSVKVRRYNYLLESLAQRCSCEEINIADMSVAAQQILREKYGKEVKNITLLEAANEDLAYGCSKDDFAKYMTLAIQLLK